MSDASATPMMKQYLAMRRELPEDVLLMYRLGDFYELFFQDAQTASPILNVALTKRNGIPMCGVPHHSAQGYIAKLITAGKRVAIAEQTTEPVPGNWKSGGYLERSGVPKDPWGHPYQYLSPGTKGEIDVFSLGADHQPGGEGADADVGSWQL